MKTVKETIVEVLKDVSGQTVVGSDFNKNLKDVLKNYDSLSHVETVMGIEEELRVEIKDEDMDSLISVDDFARYVESKKSL